MSVMSANKNRKSICFSSDLCIGCYSCVVSCMDQNDLDVTRDDLAWRHIEQVPSHGGATCVAVGPSSAKGDVLTGSPYEINVSIACMHCEDAACITACPSGALTRDADTGSVIVRRRLCIGCHACAMACPFGAPRFGADGRMQKCDGCYARTQFGLEPACVRNCPTSALTYECANDAAESKAAAAAKRLA